MKSSSPAHAASVGCDQVLLLCSGLGVGDLRPDGEEHANQVGSCLLIIFQSDQLYFYCLFCASFTVASIVRQSRINTPLQFHFID